MRGVLVVHTAEEYEAWLKKQHEEYGDHEPEDDDMWKYWREGLRKWVTAKLRQRLPGWGDR